MITPTKARAVALGALPLCLFATVVAAGGGPGGQGARGVPGVPGVGEPGGPDRPLTPAEMDTWLLGRAIFDKNFHRSDGLGTPELNADSCRACHRDPAMGGAGGLELNVSRFGFDNGGAGPFVDLPGGQGLSKLRPPYEEGREEYDPFTADVFEQRQTPTILGGGLMDSIFDASITANEDPNDLNGDGVFGVARRLDVNGTIELGRFGWKGQIPHLGDFIRDAMAGECGITTPDNGRGFGLIADGDPVADPELSPQQFTEIDFFLAHLGPPLRAGSQDPRVAQGEIVFDTLGCAVCHVPTLAGRGGDVPLYSNLLLHNIMPANFRGMEEPGAAAGFFQTPPLWGIKDTAPYLHDGRAETLHDSIVQHLGEATQASTDYVASSAADRDALIAFLEDL